MLCLMFDKGGVCIYICLKFFNGVGRNRVAVML